MKFQNFQHLHRKLADVFCFRQTLLMVAERKEAKNEKKTNPK